MSFEPCCLELRPTLLAHPGRIRVPARLWEPEHSILPVDSPLLPAAWLAAGSAATANRDPASRQSFALESMLEPFAMRASDQSRAEPVKRSQQSPVWIPRRTR